MPTATDLVTDLPADFEVFGQAVASSMADLLGGTSGQILAKNSNTDMDFVWIANDQGDITGITATTPLTGGGTSGAITVGIQDASTSQKGSVQLSDSTSTTSSVLASTPTATKAAYDLANGAIPKSLIDAAGDLIVGTADNTAARLPIGTTGQILTVAAGTASWATPAAGGGGKVLQVVNNKTSTNVTSASTSYADTGLTATITPTLSTSKILVLVNQAGCGKQSSDTALQLQLLRGASVLAKLEGIGGYTGTAAQNFIGSVSSSYLDSPATTSATTYKTQLASFGGSGDSCTQQQSSVSTITLLEIGA